MDFSAQPNESGGVAVLLSGERTSIDRHARKAHSDAFVNEDMLKYGDQRVLNAMTKLALCEYLPASILTSPILLEHTHAPGGDAFQRLVGQMITTHTGRGWDRCQFCRRLR
jgi:hypothetical protein